MFSTSAISSNTTTTGSFNLITILFIMLLLSGVAAAFRSSTASASASVAASTSASRRSASTTADRTGGDDARRREEVPPPSTSLASDVVQAAADVIERSHRRYWTELAPPFGIRGGLRKLRKRERRVHTRNEQSSSASIRSRSVVTGSLLKGVDGGDAGADNHVAASLSSDYTWDEHGESERGGDDTEKTLTHLCFLVHGHRGQSKDLSYMHAAIQGRSSEVRRQRREKLRRLESSRSSGDDAENNEIAAAIDQIRASLGQNVLVHSATCNEGKTNDGVRAGGERLVEEMLQVIRKEADRTRRKNQRHRDGDLGGEEVVDITLSLVGNSLGGIYSRYAIALLFEMAEEVDENDVDCSGKTFLLDNGSIRLRFETFCTTATPHLGCSRHTYVSLPRSAETAVGNFLGETGRDLFRMNDLLYSMGTDTYFLHPLSQFRRRVAYANAYHTDFPVPAATAAFLHEESSHAHFWDASSGDSEWDKSIVAILHTQPSYSSSLSKDCKDDLFGDCEDELHAMSKSLDSLGWKKVIVDLRSEIPAVGIPNVIRKNSLVMKVKQQNGNYQHDGITDEGFEENLVPVQNGTLSDSEELRKSLRRKGSIASRDAREAFGSPRDGSLHLPVGHNMICAFSRGRVSSHMNRGGRPVMDALAKELVDEILGAKSGSSICL